MFVCMLSLDTASALGLAGAVTQEDGQPVAGVMIKAVSVSAPPLWNHLGKTSQCLMPYALWLGTINNE
jgi:hypothetical protein